MIIGLTGTNGAGKGAIAQHLKHKGFAYLSLSDIVREEATRRGLAHDRPTLTEVADSLREAEGPGALAKRVIAKIKKIKEKNIIVDSVRNEAEVNELRKSEGFVLIAVDARLALRYERVVARQRPGDRISFEEFKAADETEMQGKATRQQKAKAMQMADYKIMNDGSVQELWQKVDEILGVI